MTRPLQSDGRVHGIVVGIEQNEKWLMIRRSATVPLPLRICFPGGAIETNEPHEQAAKREMLEELNIEIQPLKQVWKWDSPEKPLTLWGYSARIAAGNLKSNPDEIAEVLWLTAIEGANHADALPTNFDFLRALGAL